MYIGFSIAIIVICLLYIGYLIFKHLPDLKNIDLESIFEERQDQAKSKILEEKFLRQSAEVKEKLEKVISPRRKFLVGQFGKIKDNVARLESKYYDNKKKIKVPLSIQNLYQQALKLIKQNDFVVAEKNLIEIISRDNKNIMAYEALGDLYFKTKSYDQAEEIYKYLIKLQTIGSKDKNKLDQISLKSEEFDELELDLLKSLDVDSNLAAYHDDLGGVYEAMNQIDKALDCYLKATSIEPNNPKYLDKLIELSIKTGDRGLAKKTFNHLKKINPENAKLVDFEETIEKIK